MSHCVPFCVVAIALALSGCGTDGPDYDLPPPLTDAGTDAAPSACEPGMARECTAPGGCAGMEVCIEGRYEPCVALPVEEACDGVDEDCDGRVDERVPGVGAACEYMRGTCQIAGAMRCEGGRMACAPDLEAAPPESCNGVDDDCDGETDEAVPPTACADGLGACRAMGEARCVDGRMRCDAEAGAPGAELCNGVDDDCDGTADEDPADVGRSCGTGRPGVCAAGRRACDAGQPVCAPETPATDEACNGLDDDCDGEVDEAFAVGEVCTAGIGGCATEGRMRCVDGIGACDAQPGPPRAEVCNGEDDDCDGEVDEQPPRDELCNGGDDDCDGAIDEDFELGLPCSAGRGACESAGQTACGAGGAVVCGAVAGDPRDELCNGIDDDCDGDLDEGMGVGVACAVGVGACAVEGATVCGPDGALLCPVEPGEPVRERCDGVDRDCDGAVDEGFRLGEGCALGTGACRAEGARVCDGAGGAVCDAEPGSPGDEACNGVDDDCDGTADEGFPVGGACEVGVGACRARGAFACADDGTLFCDADGAGPGAELCNGLDDDCDGAADEGLGLGAPCTVGLGICARPGERVCAEDGAVVCAGEPGPATDESCDGRDEDCDGEVDEGLGLGDVCVVGVGECTRAAVRVCADDGGVVCDGEPGGPAAEICNGRDDDCDGEIDEVASCEVLDSCADLIGDDGAPLGESGTYLVVGSDGEPRSVGCDTEADGGGWTLVANSRGGPPPDERAAWSTGLQSVLDATPPAGVWPALRRLSLRHDIRFTCTRGPEAAPAVDIAFYDVPWYRTLTTGSDLDSCFNEDDGRGALDRAAVRRDMLSGDVRARGQGRVHADGDWLEGEDGCGSADDFAVDFDGRGLGAPPSATSWGLFDGEPRCGVEPVDGETRWQIWVRPPRPSPLGRVGLFGPTDLAAALVDSGFEVDLIDGEPGDLSGFDVIFFGRWSRAWNDLPAGAEEALDAFVRGGGALVTEFDGAALLGEGYDLDFFFRLGAPAPFGWLPMTVGGGDLDGLNSLDVHPDAVGDPIVRSLPEAIVGMRGPAYFVWTRFDGAPPGEVLTTTETRLGGEFVSTLRVSRCGGTVLMNGSSYADAADEAVMGQFVRNLAGAAASPQPAGLADVCPD